MPKFFRSPLFQFGCAVVTLTTLAAIFIPSSPRALFSTGFFMPHRHCYLDDPRMIWLQGLSDFSIGMAYMIISGALAYLVYKARRDIPFEWMFLAFGLFIFTCGWTHFMEVWTLWSPTYWLSGTIKGITAVASIATGIGLAPLMPPEGTAVEHSTPSASAKGMTGPELPEGSPTAPVSSALQTAVERMGGRVGVESERGKGGRFWIELRAAQTHS
jgi:hypothetical protein